MSKALFVRTTGDFYDIGYEQEGAPAGVVLFHVLYKGDYSLLQAQGIALGIAKKSGGELRYDITTDDLVDGIMNAQARWDRNG